MDINYFYYIKNRIFKTILLDDKTFTISDLKLSMKDVWDGVNYIGGAVVFSNGIKAGTSILKSSTFSASPNT